MKRNSFLLIFVLFLFLSSGSFALKAGEPVFFIKEGQYIRLKEDKLLCKFEQPVPLKMQSLIKQIFSRNEKKTRLISIGLAIALGPFGVHRLYLGTAPHVPVVYTVTLGGGFLVLPVADIVAILFVKDFEKYQDNPNIIMWTK